MHRFLADRAGSAAASILATLALAGASGCTGDIVDSTLCVGQNAAPTRPTIVAPVTLERGLVPVQMQIDGSTFDDAEGDRHLESEFEMWSYSAGEAIERVWSARVFSPTKLSSVALADGAFDFMTGADELGKWTLYSVRARYRDQDGDCSQWSEWSDHTPFRTDDGSYYLFEQDNIKTIELDIPPASFAAIDAEARPPGCVPHQRSYYPGTLRFEGEEFADVGIRAKGGCGSARNLDGKAAFKINLSWDDPAVAGCPDERRLHGEKRITLNNMVQDRSFTHERVGYHYYKLMGVPTPRSAYYQLMVNGELWGLYNQIETIDRRMLRRWFDSNQGMLYEGTYWCDLLPTNVPPDDDDSFCITRKFKPGTCTTPEPNSDPETYDPIRDFVAAVEALPQFYPDIEGLVQFDQFLSMWAADSVLGHWDGYQFDIMNNYRVYHDVSTGLWTVIPSGIDQTFDRDQNPFAVSGVLASRCLADAACEERFLTRLEQAADVFESGGLESIIDDVDALIGAAVATDPRKPGSIADYQNLQDAMRNFIQTRPDRIRQLVAQRRNQ